MIRASKLNYCDIFRAAITSEHFQREPFSIEKIKKPQKSPFVFFSVEILFEKSHNAETTRTVQLFRKFLQCFKRIPPGPSLAT